MSKTSLRKESSAFAPAKQARPAFFRTRAVTSAAQFGTIATAKKGRTMRVGFIGVDHTATAMVLRLMRAGHELAMYGLGEIPVALESAGGRVASSIQDACRSADAVFTMLPNDDVTEAVVLGPGGVVESLPGKAIHIGSSTVSVECSDRIVEAHWDAGKQYISAPVLARSVGTAGDQLLVIAAGREATIVQVEPLFSRIGQMAQVSGWPSDANVIQLGASYMGGRLFQFLARHPELCSRHYLQVTRPGSPLARFLGIQAQGVLQ